MRGRDATRLKQTTSRHPNSQCSNALAVRTAFVRGPWPTPLTADPCNSDEHRDHAIPRALCFKHDIIQGTAFVRGASLRLHVHESQNGYRRRQYVCRPV